MPRIGTRPARIAPAGDLPDAARPPAGCGFHPRWPVAVARCRTEVPALRRAGPGHLAACHRAAEVLAGLPLG